MESEKIALDVHLISTDTYIYLYTTFIKNSFILLFFISFLRNFNPFPWLHITIQFVASCLRNEYFSFDKTLIERRKS